MRPLPLVLLLGSASLGAQAPKPAQLVKPPVAQAWIDLATHHSDLPAMPGMGGGMPGLGQLFGKGGGDKARGNVFGQTQALSGFGASGQYLDSAVHTRGNRGLSEALQAVAPASLLAPQLQLLAPPPERAPEPVPSEDEVREPQYEKPKGRLLLYWGCGEQVRAGQPRVLDFARMNLQDVQKIMVARGSTPRGARSQPGVPAWPNKQDDRKVPAGSRLAGETGFTGQGIPEGFRFQLRPEVDFMPAIALQRQASPTGATQLSWQRIEPARAYFLSAMGAKPGAAGEEGAEMVMWSSSELPDTGFALHDYQTPAGIERLLKERVLLAPATTQCAIPAGIFGAEAGAGMLRMIAYGPEQSVAHPPRPTDAKIPWEPEWAARVRTKSTLFAMLGMPAQPAQDEEAPKPEEKKKPKVGDVLKGLFGR